MMDYFNLQQRLNLAHKPSPHINFGGGESSPYLLVISKFGRLTNRIHNDHQTSKMPFG